LNLARRLEADSAKMALFRGKFPVASRGWMVKAEGRAWGWGIISDCEASRKVSGFRRGVGSAA